MEPKNSYTARFVVDKSPEDVFEAVNHVRGWWSGEVVGATDQLGSSFTYRVPEVHYSQQTVTELIPAQRVVWHVSEAELTFVQKKDEWKGTDLVFEITKSGEGTELRFTHRGLVPQFECHEACSNAWALLVNGNLQRLINTGKDQPSPW